MRTLTKRQIGRQDFVDNQIYETLQKLIPLSKMIEWDIEIIGTIREAVREQIVDERRIMNEIKFYPYLKL